ncbi:golvesin C-terminal-like domain-containing protein [Streptomyces sp. CB00072]|uniref:golvesin C-terminal-like domain-containing protein n=1 Tax=Streptomyces sp. CB00072 TaxID=1703928 RepID=UPI0009A0B15F|nr:DNRLRE domain-containing protein [Streptomyces sp. CB00072]
MVFVTPAAAADASGNGGGKAGVFDTVKDWFTDEEDPEPANALEMSSREKLPKGKKDPEPKRVKELKNRRTPSARFFELSDGRVEAELTAVPTAYQDEKDKSWKPIDVSVRETSKENFEYANTANLGRTYFGSEPGELVRVEGVGGESVTLGLDTAATSGGKNLKPTAKGSKVVYANAVEGADLEYVVEPGQVKENIVLTERPDGPVKFTFTLDAGGLTPKSRKDGSIALFGEAPKTPVMVIPAPYMTDAAKDTKSPTGGTYSTEVTQKLTRAGDGWKITVLPDTKWLAAKDRRYPVVIDPTITITPDATGSKDTMVLSDQPSTNFNTTWKMSAGKTDTGISRSLVEFPLSEIPAGVKVDSARLGMYFDQSHTTNANDVTIGAYRATGTWTEGGATWSNTSGLVGELSGTTVQIDDGDAGTAAVGEWPRVATTSTANVGSDYAYNKNAATGESYTYQPRIAETASYRVEAHYSPHADNTTAAPYKVLHDGLTHNYTVDQTVGTTSAWKALTSTQLDFNKGNADKIVLGDTGESTKRTMADAVRLVNPASIVKNTGEYNQWHNFPVTDTVQKWVSGTAANHGFVLKATDESATAPTGGPRYEAADGSTYGGETATIPRLTVTYGKVGTSLNSPEVVHSTGPELSWPAYKNNSGDTELEIAEYQLHRSTQQAFTPSPATLVAPIAKTATTYTDTTATPSPNGAGTPEIGRSYYYQIAVKTADGQLLGSPTRTVGIPKPGRTMRLLQGTDDVTDTTLSSQQPTTNQDTIQSFGVGQKWLSTGDNSGTYGTTRAALKFNTTAIPTTATVLEGRMYMWGSETTNTSAGAVYELHGLNKTFDETTATWNQSATSAPWTAPGGDFSATVSDTVPQFSEEVGRHWWDATTLAKSWVKTPAGNKGALVKLAGDTDATQQERTLWLASEAADYQLGPLLRVIYVDSTTEDTYYAPRTPARMTPNSTYTVDMTVTNTTSVAWAAGERQLSYTWKLPDGTDVTDVTTGGNQAATAVPALIPGESATVKATVKTPINSDSGSKRTEYVLGWDVKKVADGSWLSVTNPSIAPLKQPVAVEDPTSNSLGMEKFYAYAGKNTGAGSTVMNNLASGNSVWSYNVFSNPGRGLTTFARFAYNSLDTSDTVAGHGWSLQAAGPIRLGAPLDFHPNPNPSEIRLPDGDGTTHVFRKQEDGTWKAPAGVHYRVTMKAGLDCTPAKDPVPDAWTMTRPDGTRFLFGCDGYLTSTVDKNGNTQLFTYEERKSNNKPTKFLKYITDPAGRQSLSVEYWDKGQNGYQYINNSGVLTSDTGSLNNSKIYDHVRSVTDISGRRVEFYYTDKGLLGQFTDGVGSSQPKNFKFTYDATQGNKNVKLVKVTDPRGNGTSLAYYAPQSGDNPKYHWWTKTVTDRLNGATGFGYAVDASNAKFTRSRVTDAETHMATHVTDDFGRPVQTTNAKSQTTKMSWDADNNVTYMEEDNGAKTAYCYDQKTGYPLWQRDAENNKTGVPPAADCAPGAYPANSQQYRYQTRLDGFSADLHTKTSPEGNKWQFGYDSFGNLKTVTDPEGVATATADDYTTKNEYDAYGQLTKVIDAKGNPTTNSDFGPTGYPATITDALGNATSYVYDERGQVKEVTDALGKKVTQTYDTFGRPKVATVPKEAGVVITTPEPEYDANDNTTTSTSPNGAVSTAVYDAADQITSATAPKDTSTSGERKSTYTYDKVGNLRTTTEPKGSLTTSDATDYVTTNTYDEVYQLLSAVNADGDRISYTYDNVGNLTKVVDPKKNATADPDDYMTMTAYDLNHRVTTVTDAAGKSTSRTYNKDSLVVETKDAENNSTFFDYDKRGKQKEIRAPYSATTFRKTQFEYDQVGNTTKVITPRGTATTGTADDFAQRTEYDALNRPVKQFQPFDPADGRYNKADVYTQTSYDPVGRVAKTSLPPSAGETVRNDTTYEYFDNGWTRKSTDPWDITTTYDYTETGQQKARTLTSAGGSSDRTMAWSYYPDGKLKSKSDDGVPVGKSVVLVDNSDTQHTSSTGTWATGDLTGQQGYNHRTHTAGTGADAFTWTLNIPKDGTYTAYVKYPKITGAATTAKYTLKHGTTTEPSVTKDQTANTGTWVGLGSYTLKQGEGSKLELAQNSGGAVVADAVKLVRDTSSETDSEKHTFAYAYDVNSNLTSVDDTSSGAKIDAYTVTYTGLNQVAKVTEALAGAEKKVTSYTYDANGQTDTVTHPNQFSKYTYDLREQVKTVSVGKTASDASPKVSSYTYTDRGQKLQETKANKNTVDSTYYLNGALKSTTEKKGSGTLVSSHTYAYDANGNKAQDVAKKMNADNHAAYLDSTTDYTYDPANRLAKSVKTGTGAGTDTYVHDDNANVISQSVKGVSTTFDYDRNRLLTATVGGSTASYTYDPFGRQESVTASGKIVERSVYDGFDHIVESQKADDTGALKSTKFTFDPLDRTASKTADGKTTDFNYLGMSSEVLGEEVAGELTKSYQYSPWGERLSQVSHNADGTSEDGFYGYNSHTDVETLTDKEGDTKATYGYTAYGSDDKDEFTGIDKPQAADPSKDAYNPYRFNAKRWDAQTGTYDMGFRDYSPGLNRFTSRDMYNGALSDMGLGSDPFTGNRYAFTGGNPVSNVELDGHIFGCSVCDDVIDKVGDLVSDATKKTKGGWLSIADTFLTGIGWYNETAPNGYETEPGATPDYGKGLLVKPDDQKEWTGGVTRFPFQDQGCKDSRQSMIYYMPLDDAGRAQGAIGCLNWHDTNNVDKGTGEVYGDGGIFGSGTVWPTDDPLYIPKAMQKGGPLYRKGLERGHLIASRFGGSGTDIRNLAPIHGEVNRGAMARVEDAVAEQINSGNTVFYQVMVHYPSATDPMPDRFDITWNSSSGASGSVPVYNTP